MDVSVPDREISVLNIDKIPEKSGKSEFFVGGPKISIFENWLIFYIRIKKMSNLVKFHQNICIFEDFTAIYFLCVFYKDLTWNWKFFSDHVTKKIHKKQFRHCINLKFCQNMPNWIISKVTKLHKTTVCRFVATINFENGGQFCPPPGSNRVKRALKDFV